MRGLFYGVGKEHIGRLSAVCLEGISAQAQTYDRQ